MENSNTFQPSPASEASSWASNEQSITRNVSASQKSINEQSKSVSDTSPNTETTGTSPKSTPTLFPTLTFSLEASLVQSLSLAGKRGGFDDTPRHNVFLNRADCPVPNNLQCLSLRMSMVSSPMMKAEPLGQSSPRLMNWGTMRNGVCLTASISSPSPFVAHRLGGTRTSQTFSGVASTLW